MKHIIKLTCFVLITLMTGSCAVNKSMSNSDAVINSVSGKKVISEGGLIYGLPLTVLDIEIETERVVEKPGPYAHFAGELLGLTDVITAEKESWAIKGIIMSTHQELDPEQFYVVETGKVFETNVLALKKSGLILDLNPEIYNSLNGNKLSSEMDMNRLNMYDLGSDEYFEDKRDTLYRIVSVDTAFVRIPYLVVKKQKLTVDQLAENAAVRLMELRDGKHLILTGETNVSPQNEAAINELNRLEKEYTELFTGKTFKERRVLKYQIIPRRDMTGNKTTLCMFSELTGPGAITDTSGSPLVIEFTPEVNTRSLNIVSTKTNSSASRNYNRLIYRVPDVVTVRIKIGDEVLNQSRKLIYQFGEIIRLPSNYIIGK
jgi:hypothetical protein